MKNIDVIILEIKKRADFYYRDNFDRISTEGLRKVDIENAMLIGAIIGITDCADTFREEHNKATQVERKENTTL